MTLSNGGNWLDQFFYPWGQDWVHAGVQADFRFASLGQPLVQPDDLVGGFNPTPFRNYSPTFGRWLTPDPLGGDILNPQSLNRYAYVLNNPTSLIDPLGLWPDDSKELDNGSDGLFGDVFRLLDIPVRGGTVLVEGTIVGGPIIGSGASVFGSVGRGSVGGGGGGGGGGGNDTGPTPKPDPRVQVIRRTVDDLFKALLNDPDCLSFLGSRLGALQALATVPISLGYAPPSVVALTNVSNTLTQIAPIDQSIVINRLGVFFAGTPRFQAATLLHELGHVTGVLQPDANVPNARNAALANDAAIRQHCNRALSAFRNR